MAVYDKIKEYYFKEGIVLNKPLSKEERDNLLSLVTEDQKDFLLHKLKRGRQTIFGNFMLSEKVHAIKSADEIELSEEEQDVVDWKIVEYVDHGLGNRLGMCACGRTLRYEFTVQHTKTKKTITYGKHHLADFLNLNVREIDDVLYELNTIDYELDELLLKIKEDDFGYEILDELPNTVELSEDIQEHVKFQVPLLNRQIKRLSKIIEKMAKEKWLKKVKEQSVEQKLQSEAYEKAKQLIVERLEKEEKEKKSEEQKVIEDVSRQLPVQSEVGEIALSLVQNGISSAVEMSQMIRNHFNVDKRMSMSVKERPYIYMDVLLALMAYVERGDLIFDEESSGIEDCIFFVNTERKIENIVQKEVQATLF